MNVSVDQSILNVTLVVATHLLRNEAILLSDAYDIFTQSITESSTLPQITPNATLSKRAFHKHLISSLQEYLECRTVEQSVGIILYRKGGDTLKSLSKSLAKQRHARVIHAHKPTPTTDPNKPMCTADTTNQTTDAEDGLLTLCNMVNDQVHNAIDKLLQQDREQPLDLSIIDIEQQIARADPTVWQMLRLIARTREERKKPIKSFL